MESIERRIAYFISPHGFGHAARSAAVMEAACRADEKIRFEIFTQVPEWFFLQSLTHEFGYHSLQTDLGLVQTTPFVVDLRETISRLDEMLPFDVRLIESLSRQLIELRCEMVVCDIAPMGIIVAERARLPSILVENFTWDWIYAEYASDDSRIGRHSDYL
ncbi:MAG TPA: glycosyltransferase family protein, partial [Pyrinomonadaceae bacterium]|nr:glycosyltransferase family protein [Pyrinomonadaceae bacterium]